MKKLISLLLLLAMVLSLAACGEKAPAEEQAAESAAPVEETPAGPEPAAVAAELFFSGSYEEAYASLADIESGSALWLKALCSYYGLGTDVDADAAVDMLEGSESLVAKVILADAANTGNGAVQNPEKAKELYTELIRAADSLSAEDAEAGIVFVTLANCYTKGISTEIDLAKAKTALDKAIKSGKLSVFDKIELAHILEEFDRVNSKNAAEEEEVQYNEDGSEKAKPDSAEIKQAKQLYTEAREGIEKLAESGNVKAIKLLGDYYLNGLGGLEQDYVLAMEYFSMAADEDYADAQAQIAYMYMEGLGVEVSYEQAMEWNNRAAQQNNAQGQAQIGYMYHMGLGVTQNLDEAGRWYARAVDQGHPWATEKLAETELTNNQAYFEAHA